MLERVWVREGSSLPGVGGGGVCVWGGGAQGQQFQQIDQLCNNTLFRMSAVKHYTFNMLNKF